MKKAVLALLPILACASFAEGKNYVVAIDVGHTRASPGAISVTGRPEYEFNLRIAKKLEEKLKEGNASSSLTIEPFIISSDKPMALPTRTKIAALHHADLFVSIHHDSAQDQYLEEREVNGQEQRFSDKFSGYSIFVSRKNPHYDESLALAKQIGKAMQRATFKFARHHHENVAGENRPYADEASGVYAFDDLVVLKTASMPAVLVECGVILNPTEEKDLLTEARQAAIVAAIIRGIREYLGQEPVTRGAQRADVIETSTPSSSPSRYPKPGTTASPRPAQEN